MYYQNYEDYMRSVLGYQEEPRNTYEPYNYAIMPYENQVYSISNNYSNEIMDLYPEIYKLINPMVCKICEANTKPITRELIEQMTDEIYLNIESTPEINTVVDVRLDKSKDSSTVESNNRTSKTSKTTIASQSETKILEKENRETRRIERNRTLQDLIKILILNQLLGIGRPPREPHRPPFPPRPPVRPPRPRDDRYYNNYF